MTTIDTQGDSLLKGVVSLPTVLSAWDDPTLASSSSGGVLDKINKGVGSSIGLSDGVLTSGPSGMFSGLFRDGVVALIGLVFLGVGLYAVTK